MDLKSLTAALSIAFVTVILDAVFRFHYVYVLIIVTVMAYAFVRTLIRSEHTGSSPEPAPGSPSGGLIWGLAAADSDLDKTDREALVDHIQSRLSTPSSSSRKSGRTTKVDDLVRKVAGQVTKDLELESGKTLKLVIPHPAFTTQLAALVESLDVRTVIRAANVKSAKSGYVRLTVEVNRVYHLGDSPMDASYRLIQRQLEGTGGLAWISHPPRKTRIHLILPGA